MAESKRGLVPEDVFGLRTVTECAVSPDGARAAITVNFADREKDEYRSVVAMVDLNDGTLRNCTQEDKKSWSAQFSPDGANLAFLSDRSGAPQVWVMPLSGGEPRQLTFFKHGADTPRWSPDGKRLAFLSGGGEKQHPGLTGEQKKQEKPEVRVLKTVRYREDGRGFFQDKLNHVYVVDAGGGEPIQLTDGENEDKSIAWSPDGSLIAFVSNRSGDTASNATDVWVVDSDGRKTAQQVTTSGYVVDVPCWSADGTQLCVLGEPFLHSAGRSTQIAIVQSKGSAPKFMTDPNRITFASVIIGVGHAAWFPPPRWTEAGIFAIGNREARQNLFVVSPDGQPKEVTVGDHSIFAFDVTRDGNTVVFTASRPDDPVNLYVQKNRGVIERVTDLNPWLDDLVRPKIESFKYRSKDGTQLDAWLYNPPGADPKEKLPLVLLIHGGPHCAYGYAWNRNAVLYAAAGYRVLTANPRGSAGYGESFARAIHPMQGDVDQADLLAGVDAAIARGGVDEKRLAITGGSYGGFMTNLMLGRTDRFRTGVTICCISNWVSYYGTADYGWMMAWEFEDEVWASPRRYISQSPLSYVTAIKVPLLILHGEEDYRCPIEQAEQIFAILQRRGVTTEMRRYPGEPHSIGSRRPSFAVDMLDSALRWFSSYL